MKLEKIEIGNLFIDNISYDDILKIYTSAINNNGAREILYVNANTIVLSREIDDLCSALNSGANVHPDGIGIFLASKFLGRRLKENFNWTDCAHIFLKFCETQGWSIFFLGGETEIINLAEQNIRNKYPRLNLLGVKNGYSDINSKDLISSINKQNPQILWVGLGTPNQELWISENRHLLKCNIIHAVGDIFSLFAGVKIRGPKILRDAGFEWAFRLLIHPKKYFSRYVIGIPKFGLYILKEKLCKYFFIIK